MVLTTTNRTSHPYLLVSCAKRNQSGLGNDSLVKILDYLTFEEASTLPCAALTRYNALFRLIPRKGGDTVLVQGSGGVSVRANGADVIVTTSPIEKGKILKELGATHVINYKETPKWDEDAVKMFAPSILSDFLPIYTIIMASFTPHNRPPTDEELRNLYDKVKRGFQRESSSHLDDVRVSMGDDLGDFIDQYRDGSDST
ncbi:NAD-binding protein [Sanghuangporus baumii]|uniref:NAD-binding protein n=1 Tax=Sanghuangporus baumii TaxID=108892 RepID=A0A9Q5HTP7_SANBA|nr:NAD-binding protein [Sanghuangporus baumii]